MKFVSQLCCVNDDPLPKDTMYLFVACASVDPLPDDIVPTQA